MSKAYEIEPLRQSLWRQYPNWPSTFNPCSALGCKNSAHGGGLCSAHIERKLAGFVGEELAEEYHEAVRQVRKLERKMDGRDEG